MSCHLCFLGILFFYLGAFSYAILQPEPFLLLFLHAQEVERKAFYETTSKEETSQLCGDRGPGRARLPPC